MKKFIKELLFYAFTFLAIFLPFLFPDEMVYVKKGTESIYVPFTYLWMLISTFIVAVLACIGIICIFKVALKDE